MLDFATASSVMKGASFQLICSCLVYPFTNTLFRLITSFSGNCTETMETVGILWHQLTVTEVNQPEV